MRRTITTGPAKLPTFHVGNGFSISFIPDPMVPLHWEAWVTKDGEGFEADGMGPDGLAGALTTDEAQRLIQAVAKLAA